jgi:flagellar assembly factor FliW
MIEIDSKPFGKVQIDQRQKIHFPYGILGFEHLKEYALLDAAQEPFYWLQSLEVKEIAFVLLNPLIFQPDYNVELDDDELQELGVEKPDDLLLFVIVTVPKDARKMTANLQGPVIIGREKKLGRQFISNDLRWKTKHLVIQEHGDAGKQSAVC